MVTKTSATKESYNRAIVETCRRVDVSKESSNDNAGFDQKSYIKERSSGRKALEKLRITRNIGRIVEEYNGIDIDTEH